MPSAMSDPWGDPDFEQAVRETAYFLWEHDGRPEGREQEYWYQALERHLRQRNADTAFGMEPKATHQVDDNTDDLGRPINASQKASSGEW